MTQHLSFTVSVPFDDDVDTCQGSTAANSVGFAAQAAVVKLQELYPAKVEEDTATVTFDKRSESQTIPAAELLPVTEG